METDFGRLSSCVGIFLSTSTLSTGFFCSLLVIQKKSIHCLNWVQICMEMFASVCWLWYKAYMYL